MLPVTDKTIFEGASISKSVFAFFVMTFVEEAKLNLDKPLYEYFPHPDIKDEERYKKITARMVLKHIKKTDWVGLEKIFQERIANRCRIYYFGYFRFLRDLGSRYDVLSHPTS